MRTWVAVTVRRCIPATHSLAQRTSHKYRHTVGRSHLLVRPILIPFYPDLQAGPLSTSPDVELAKSVLKQLFEHSTSQSPRMFDSSMLTRGQHSSPIRQPYYRCTALIGTRYDYANISHIPARICAYSSELLPVIESFPILESFPVPYSMYAVVPSLPVFRCSFIPPC